MITKSSLRHVRLPFSYLLLPIYLLALLSVDKIYAVKAWLVFVVLHFLLYPASNGFNSYCDRDKESIGTLKRPPEVTPDLLWLSLALDAAALVLALWAGWVVFWGCFVYGLASKAYSWNKIRIKKYPVTGWLFTGIGQGTLTFLLITLSISSVSFQGLLGFRLWFPAVAAGVFVLGFYPLTQIYQHHEDSQRGDRTISLVLGIRRTFMLAAVLMAFSVLLFFSYFGRFYGSRIAFVFAVTVFPAAVYLMRWYFTAMKDPSKADYDHAMRMSFVASSGINIFSLVTLLLVS
jgi:4-hydroxybenzoate polyprenyltransferase